MTELNKRIEAVFEEGRHCFDYERSTEMYDIIEKLWAAFNAYSPEMNEFYNGYAQAQADGVQTPLSDSDLGIGVEIQRKRILELTEREKALVDALEAVRDALEEVGYLGSYDAVVKSGELRKLTDKAIKRAVQTHYDIEQVLSQHKENE